MRKTKPKTVVRPPNGGFDLRAVRKKLGMTREELAVALGCTADSIGRWERGQHPVNKSAKKLLDVLLSNQLLRATG